MKSVLRRNWCGRRFERGIFYSSFLCGGVVVVEVAKLKHNTHDHPPGGEWRRFELVMHHERHLEKFCALKRVQTFL